MIQILHLIYQSLFKGFEKAEILLAMCDTSKETIRKKIEKKIREDYLNIKWAKCGDISKIGELTIALSSDFKFIGNGNYPFQGYIELHERVTPDNTETLSKRYKLSSNAHVEINKECNDIEIAIKEPVILTRNL